MQLPLSAPLNWHLQTNLDSPGNDPLHFPQFVFLKNLLVNTVGTLGRTSSWHQVLAGPSSCHSQTVVDIQMGR